MHGVYFALRSGQDNQNLCFDPGQVELIERPGQRTYLRYTEDISKNNPGGLKGRKYKPKVVIQQENPCRCFVRLLDYTKANVQIPNLKMPFICDP